jgi:hypothetical protein
MTTTDAMATIEVGLVATCPSVEEVGAAPPVPAVPEVGETGPAVLAVTTGWVVVVGAVLDEVGTLEAAGDVALVGRVVEVVPGSAGTSVEAASARVLSNPHQRQPAMTARPLTERNPINRRRVWPAIEIRLTPRLGVEARCNSLS